MFQKTHNKIISTILSLAVLIGIFAIGGAGSISGNAASSTTYVTIANVQRRYMDANSFFTKVNEYRTSNGLKAWTMDKDTLEAAMVRAAELALFLSDNCPDGSSGLQHITGGVKNQVIAHDVFSITNTLTNMKNNTTSNAILLGSDTTSAGVGVVSIKSTKYLVLYTSSKTPTKVSDSVLTQSNVTLDQKVHASPSNFGEVSIPYTNGQQLYCGSSVGANLKVKNKNLDGAYVLLTPENMTVKSSDEKVMKRSGDRMYAVGPGTATVSIYMTDYGYVGASCSFTAIARSFSDCTFPVIPNQYYTGKPICPNVTVKNTAGDVLTLGTDYALSYTDNVEVGTATVIITGMGAYAEETKRIYFNIVKSGGDDPSTTFTISVSVTKPEITLGQSTTIMATTSGGETPIKYTYSYANYGTTDWVVLASNSTSSSYTFKPPAVQKYYVRAMATDSKNRIATQTTVVKVNNSFYCTAKLSASQVNINHPVTITGTYSGGTSPYTYAFYVVKPGSSTETQIRSYSASNSATYTPAAAGSYKLIVKCKDNTGTVATDSKTLTAVNAELANTSSVKQTCITLGQSITIAGSATGGTKPYQYCYYYKRSTTSTWTLKKDYSTTTSVSFQPKSTGTYNLCVRVKDNTGTVAKKFIDVTVKPELVNKSTLKATSIAHGEKVVVSCAASGGSGGYKYAVYYKRSTTSTWTLKSDYSTTTSVSFTPKYSGSYSVCVKVRDSNGKVTKKNLTVKVGAALSNTSQLSASTIYKGDSVTVTCSAAGGKSTYTYAVWYKQTSKTSWAMARDYAKGTTVKITPGVAAAYTVRVKVKDSLGSVVNKDLALTVKPGLKNTSKLSSTSIVMSESVTVTCSATGGKASYTYAVWYRQTSQSTWTQARDYGTGTTVKVTPKHAVAYTVRVKAKDSTGKVVNKDLSLKVKPSLSNTSRLSASSITKGKSVTVTCSAKDGKSPYQFAVWYKRANNSTWYQAADYGSTTSVAVTPKYAETYIIRVKAKDSLGKVVNKDLTLTVK